METNRARQSLQMRCHRLSDVSTPARTKPYGRTEARAHARGGSIFPLAYISNTTCHAPDLLIEILIRRISQSWAYRRMTWQLAKARSSRPPNSGPTRFIAHGASSATNCTVNPQYADSKGSSNTDRSLWKELPKTSYTLRKGPLEMEPPPIAMHRIPRKAEQGNPPVLVDILRSCTVQYGQMRTRCWVNSFIPWNRDQRT